MAASWTVYWRSLSLLILVVCMHIAVWHLLSTMQECVPIASDKYIAIFWSGFIIYMHGMNGSSTFAVNNQAKLLW